MCGFFMETAQPKKHCCGIILCAAAKSGMRVTAKACWGVGEGESEEGGVSIGSEHVSTLSFLTNEFLNWCPVCRTCI